MVLDSARDLAVTELCLSPGDIVQRAVKAVSGEQNR
jgi:hypothetical protein